MSRILTQRKFREGWDDDRFLVGPSDEKLDQLIPRSCDEFTSRRRNDGQEVTLTIEADSIYVALPVDLIDTVRNQDVLRDVISAVCPNNFSGSYNNSAINQLNYNNQYYPGASPELYHNLSQPLRPPAPPPIKVDIQRRKINGISRPVLVLPSAPSVSSTAKIKYQGRHQIENASALLTVNSNLLVGEKLTAASADIEETEFTFVASGATTYQINIGANGAVTAANVKAKLIALLTDNDPPEPGFEIKAVGSALTIVAADGDDFTIETNSDNISIVYTAAINTIPSEWEGDFFKILEALVLRATKSQDLIEGKNISVVQREAKALLDEALSNITPRVIG